MKTGIDFESYLSEEERKEIIADVFRSMCAYKFKEDAERIFSNAAYEVVYNIVDEQHNGETDRVISDKVKDVIEKLSEYTVFRRKDPWGGSESKGQMALDEAIITLKPQLEQKVSKIIDGITNIDVRDLILDAVNDILQERLFNK